MLLCNPYVGAGEDRNLRVARDNGHEIGLHGGRNHGVWMRKARLWNRRQLTEEIDWGLNALRTAGVDSVTSFASPGWQGSDLLNEVLVEREFNVVSDTRAALCERVSVISQGRLRSVPVNLLSEPGGRGYLEGKYAQGAEFRTIVDEFRNDVRRFGRFVVVYGHPNFCGRVGLLAMRRLVEVALEEGFTPVTISELTRRVPSE
jgi:peptidoglycan/xylan/chitin deacetylase (PgdA/CDA1 family)